MSSVMFLAFGSGLILFDTSWCSYFGQGIPSSCVGLGFFQRKEKDSHRALF